MDVNHLSASLPESIYMTGDNIFKGLTSLAKDDPLEVRHRRTTPDEDYLLPEKWQRMNRPGIGGGKVDNNNTLPDQCHLSKAPMAWRGGVVN